MTLTNRDDNNKKSFFKKLFSLKDKRSMKGNSFDLSEFDSESSVQSLFPNRISNSMPPIQAQTFRTYVATWNVGGKSPHDDLNLDGLLQIHYPSDIYVLGFQEIVPLNAGNVLVVEDNEPAAKWLSLINQSLNKSDSMVSRRSKSLSPLGTRGSLPFQKPYLKRFSENFRTESGRRLKSCNCPPSLERRNGKDYCFWCPQSNINEGDVSSEDEDDGFSSCLSAEISAASNAKHKNYSLIMAKQMVGIFLTIWVRKEHVQYVGHLRVSCTGRGIMGCLGNKGCISVRMTVHQTSFCFVCSHLASGEKEGDELRRNTDVVGILKNTQFPRVCRSPYSRVPEKILEHDRAIWLGDLNYRIALNYSETRKLVEMKDWGALFDKDQLKIERESGRVFSGWKEGKIYFAPTYKYSYNSDIYAGETAETKKQRRTPAWCDRILWHGNGIRQLSYVRLEFQFSDHRPVCATFLVDVEAMETSKKGCNMKVASEEHLPLKIK